MKNLEKKKRVVISNAVVISILFHVLLIFIAGNIVALRFYKKKPPKIQMAEERPRLERQALQMPVKTTPIIDQMSKPKMKQTTRILSKGPAALSLPEAETYRKMLPEPSFDGSFTNDVSFAGLMELTSKFREVSFGVSEAEIEGVRAKGEKIVVVVDASASMLIDRRGGADSYQILKDGVQNMIESLSSATLFNVILFDDDKIAKFHPKLAPATLANKAEVLAWFAPVNALGTTTDPIDVTETASNLVTAAQGETLTNTVADVTTSNLVEEVAATLTTTNPPVAGIPDDLINYQQQTDYECPMAANDRRGWIKGLQAAFELQPEAIFVIGADWGPQTSGLGISYYLKYDMYDEYQEQWTASYIEEEEKTYLTNYLDNVADLYQAAEIMLKLENQARAEQGLAPKAVRDWADILTDNKKKIPTPERSTSYETVSLTPADTRYCTEDLLETLFFIAMDNYGKKGFPRINYLLFSAPDAPEDIEEDDSDSEGADRRLSSEMKYKALAKFCRGKFSRLYGADEIKNVLEQDLPELEPEEAETAEEDADTPATGE